MNKTDKVWTNEQLQFARELHTDYGIDHTQIDFDKESGELVLDFEALQAVVHNLCPAIVSDEVTIHNIDNGNGYYICNAILTLGNGKQIIRPGVALMGEQLRDSEPVLRITQAVSLATARAYRSALRAIGFDATRAHRQRAAGEPVTLEAEFTEADTLRKELHALATDLGLIQGKDRTVYRELLRVMYGGRTSSLQLDDDEVRQLVAYLRARLIARERARDLKAA